MPNNQMTIVCKYKFQDSEKFNGEPYCTLLNELCKDIRFICDNNCQVYQDYKELEYKKLECRNLNLKIIALNAMNNTLKDECKNCKEINQLKFKKIQLQKSADYWHKIANSIQNKKISKYKQALTEIKKYCEEQNLKADFTACEILQKLSEVEDV